MPNSKLQSQIQVALLEAQQSHLRARWREQRVASGAYKDRVGKVFHGVTDKVPFTEQELAEDEIRNMSRHIQLAQEHLEFAKGLIEQLTGGQS